MNGLFELMRKRKTGCWVEGNFLGMIGYADDNFLLSPTLDGLQEMLKTCEDYAASHNLRFSTDGDPNKCKTKCLAFLQKKRYLPPMYLCDVPKALHKWHNFL